MVEEGGDVGSLPVYDTSDLFRVMWVYKYVVIVEVIMPEM